MSDEATKSNSHDASGEGDLAEKVVLPVKIADREGSSWVWGYFKTTAENPGNH